MTRKPKFIAVRPAGPGHQVVTTQSSSTSYRKKTCSDCPWKVSSTGEFPAEAFRLSARTAYDMSENVFSCHQSGSKKPATCAGFLLRGADHNLAVRMGYMTGRYKGDVSDSGEQLHENYRAMAIANGVDPADPVLAPCR